MKRWNKLFLFFLLVLYMMTAIANAETLVGDVGVNLHSGKIEYEGSTYIPKKRITTILLMGIDKETEDLAIGYRNGGQADFLLLLVFDDNANTITPIQINRDTMTDIVYLTAFGQEQGTWTAQICLSHGFGDGREQSCEYTVQAVSAYFDNIKIDGYYALNMDGIAILNDALGGVTVTLEDDFTSYDETMTKGKTMILHGKQAEYYTRMRYHIGEETNISRLHRQEVYIAAVEEKLKSQSLSDRFFIKSLIDSTSKYRVTDLSQGRLLNMAALANDYDINELQKINGEAILGDSGHMEFYADQDSLWETIITTFYEKI